MEWLMFVSTLYKVLIIYLLDGDLNNFDQRLKQSKQPYGGGDNDSSSEEEVRTNQVVDRKNPVYILEQKNKVLLDRLYKSEKELEEIRSTYDVLKSDNDSLKDKKIIELSKKTRALQI